MLNYKLQNNLGELGREFVGRDIDAVTGGVKSDVFYPGLDVDHDTNEELYARKKAWADLEREQEDVKQNIKALMRRAPQSAEIDNPLAAGIVSTKNPVNSNYRVPQDVMLERKHSRQFEDLQARELRPDGQRSRDAFHAAEGGASDNAFADDYKQDHLTKSRDRQDKAGNYGSNQDLSLSSQSKTLQTQKRRWKASDADSKERKPSPLGDPYDEKAGGYGASFQNRELFTGGTSDFANQKKDSRASPNLNAVDKSHTRSNASSISPDRSKAPGGPDTTKPAEPAPPKKASLFGGKKERLNPLRKAS